jgi:hypothetical protein
LTLLLSSDQGEYKLIGATGSRDRDILRSIVVRARAAFCGSMRRASL